jgi:hypothetical protein
MPRPASLEFRLLDWWLAVPAGVGVTMDEMKAQFGLTDGQVIRNALGRIRRGRVPDPGDRLRTLRAIPIRYHREDDRYYDFSKVNADAVDAQIPGEVLANRFSELLTRVATLDHAMGPDGLARSASDLLDDVSTRQLIAQLPIERIFEVAKLTMQVAQARQLLELESLRREVGELGAGPAAAPDIDDNHQ